jgi:hypothetical protein
MVDHKVVGVGVYTLHGEIDITRDHRTGTADTAERALTIDRLLISRGEKYKIHLHKYMHMCTVQTLSEG